jgi:hypothetical protein
VKKATSRNHVAIFELIEAQIDEVARVTFPWHPDSESRWVDEGMIAVYCSGELEWGSIAVRTAIGSRSEVVMIDFTHCHRPSKQRARVAR